MKIYGITFSAFDLLLFSACGALFLVFIGLRFKSEIRNRDIFNSAAKEFFTAFQPELVRLKSESISTYDIINPAITKHLEACSLFRRHLKGRELGRFKLAQHKYYFTTPISPDNNKTEQERENNRTALIEKIEILLKFANFK